MSFFSSTSYYSYTENEFKKLNNDQNFIDCERVFSNLIKYLKKIIFFFSEKLFLKIKRYFIKKI